MASIQKIKSPLTGEIAYRAQIRVRGKSESATFPRKAEAVEWAASIETAIREGKHFPHAAARRVGFDALAKSYVENALEDFDEKQRATRIQQITWWANQFKGRTVAEITSDVIKPVRAICAAEKFTRGKPRKDKKTGEMVPPREYTRSAATVNRYVAALSAVMSSTRWLASPASRSQTGALGFYQTMNEQRCSTPAQSRNGLRCMR
jgi:hypothetical protein